MAAILNSAILDSDTAILDSDTLLSSLRFTQKHSPSILTLTQTNSIWLNLMMATILPSHSPIFHKKKSMASSSFEFCHLGFRHLAHSWQNSQSLHKTHSFILTELDDGCHLEPCHHGFTHFPQKRTSFIQSDSTWWWQPSWILLSWIQTLPSWI